RARALLPQRRRARRDRRHHRGRDPTCTCAPTRMAVRTPCRGGGRAVALAALRRRHVGGRGCRRGDRRRARRPAPVVSAPPRPNRRRTAGVLLLWGFGVAG